MMSNSFYIDKELYEAYLSQEDIDELNAEFKTAEPLFVNDLDLAIGGLSPEEILIEVGIGLISNLTWDILKKSIGSLLKRIKKNREKTIRENPRRFAEPCEKYPNVIFNIDVNNSDISISFELSCNSDDTCISEKVRIIKAITDGVIQSIDNCFPKEDSIDNSFTENDNEQ